MKLFCRPIFERLGLVVMLAGCSHATIVKDVNDKMSKEPQGLTTRDLRSETTVLIESTKGLTTDQKARLSTLRDLTGQQIAENWQQSLKLKSIIIKDLVEYQYNEKEVEQIKKSLKDLELQKLSIMFVAVDEANKILGRQAQLNGELMREFIRLQRD